MNIIQKYRKKANKLIGFTIVELLIVIVVIAILAAISIVAYSGVQARARDGSTLQSVRSIQKALELYKIDNSVYPPTNVTAGSAWGSCTLGSGYSYSIATNDSWMKALVDGGYLKSVPVHSVNDCTHYIRYLHPSATSYGCTSLSSGYYVLEVIGVEGVITPSDSATRLSCPEGVTQWPVNSTKWTFSKNDS